MESPPNRFLSKYRVCLGVAGQGSKRCFSSCATICCVGLLASWSQDSCYAARHHSPLQTKEIQGHEEGQLRLPGDFPSPLSSHVLLGGAGHTSMALTPTISQSMAKALVSLVGNQGSRLTPRDPGPGSIAQRCAEDRARPDAEAPAHMTGGEGSSPFLKTPWPPKAERAPRTRRRAAPSPACRCSRSDPAAASLCSLPPGRWPLQ